VVDGCGSGVMFCRVSRPAATARKIGTIILHDGSLIINKKTE
jgi:hypothetical protein